MAETNTSTTKRCYGCKNDVALTEFNKNKSKSDGLASECRACTKKQAKKYYSGNLEISKARRAAYKKANPEKFKEWNRQRHLRRDKEAENVRKRAFKEADPARWSEYQKKNWYKHHEKNLERKRAYRQERPALQLVYVRNRQTRQKKAMPAWANLDAIKAIYRQSAWASQISGIKHHVDHFYPLKSDVVCGLHNEFNLRIITAFDNLSKGNKFPTEEQS